MNPDMRLRFRVQSSFFSAIIVLLLILAGGNRALAQARLAPGFKFLPANAKVVIVPTDVELFEISAGGVLEPKAEWTAAATKFLKDGMVERQRTLGAATIDLSEKDADDFEKINALHGAVARAINLHHFGARDMRLPSKEGKLDWSMGESVRQIKERTGADYALFSWMRDTYASEGRVATMVLFAALGVGIPLGMQVGYASLVDLSTGQVVWFNRMSSQRGDLRDEKKAKASLNALLRRFPRTAP